MQVERVFVAEREGFVPAGEKPGYPTDDARWIWHPDFDDRAPAVLEFALDVELSAAPLVLHVTADQRFDLFLDDAHVAAGPDAGDLTRWPFASYRISAEPGPHRFRARVWWVGGHAPLARATDRGGFLLRADGPYDTALSTGRAPWRVRALGGYAFTRPDVHAYVAVGDPLSVDLRVPVPDAVPAADLGPALQPNPTGIIVAGRHLTPATLPEQFRRVVSPGRIRAVRPEWVPDRGAFAADDAADARCADWRALLAGGGRGVAIPPRSAVTVLWDLDDYYCGWPRLGVRGGRDAEVEFGWAESLVEEPPRRKGDRGEILGKQFYGMADRYRLDGAERVLEPLWWRAGRYFLLRIRTGNEALEFASLALRETRYPLENATAFRCDDATIAPIERIAMRGLQMCAHETYVDCPYFEQLMYVGDTRIEALATYAVSPDDRLPRRAVRLFNESRASVGGLTASRYPCRDPQVIPTFSMIWVGMVRDFLFWRDDFEFVRRQLPGVRALLAELERYEEPDGVPGRPPGWVFTDWVKEWPTGYPPNAMEGPSATVSLMYLRALEYAAGLEHAVGDAALARRCAARGAQLRTAIVRRFWDRRRGLLADDPARRHHSEHAQTLGLLSGAIPAAGRRGVVRALVEQTLEPRATVYFQHYVFEALTAIGAAGAIPERLALWREMVARDLKTPQEAPEPVRSDCHAWSSHPMFHLRAGVAGIRPAAPGFRKVAVRPQPGPLRQIATEVCHPRGRIEVELAFDGEGGLDARVRLPPKTPGELIWNGRRHTLRPGANRKRVR